MFCGIETQGIDANKYYYNNSIANDTDKYSSVLVEWSACISQFISAHSCNGECFMFVFT